MKKNIISLLLFFITVFCGCESKWPDNGKLDGMWQLIEIEYNDTIENVKANKVYWSIRSNLLQLSCIDGDRKYSHFIKKGNNLIIYDLCHNSDNSTADDNNEWITEIDAHLLLKWGIKPQKITNEHVNTLNAAGPLFQIYIIESLTESKMTLVSNGSKLTFRKF